MTHTLLSSTCIVSFAQHYLLSSASADSHFNDAFMQVTGKTRWEAPQSPQSIPVDDDGTFIFAEEEADRVMPSRSAVLAAGRFDLHHGIMYQGGYRAAAHALHRPHSWPRHKVGTQLKVSLLAS